MIVDKPIPVGLRPLKPPTHASVLAREILCPALWILQHVGVAGQARGKALKGHDLLVLDGNPPRRLHPGVAEHLGHHRDVSGRARPLAADVHEPALLEIERDRGGERPSTCPGWKPLGEIASDALGRRSLRSLGKVQHELLGVRAILWRCRLARTVTRERLEERLAFLVLRTGFF